MISIAIALFLVFGMCANTVILIVASTFVGRVNMPDSERIKWLLSWLFPWASLGYLIYLAHACPKIGKKEAPIKEPRT